MEKPVQSSQHEITVPGPLLQENGDLREPGYAKSLLLAYNRNAVKGGPLRLKEWDYYLVMGDGFALALTIADNSYMGLDSISLLDFREGWEITKSPMRLFPLGKTGLPASSVTGDVQIKGKGYRIGFYNDGATRRLIAHMDAFKGSAAIDADVILTDEPRDSIVICTPFSKPAHFYYNQKINCMRASGTIQLGEKTYAFDPSRDFGTLDWGRGVWTYHNTWYWGSGSGLTDGTPFGFNIGYGFGDAGAATENMLFYDGTAHKLSQVTFNIPMKNGKEDYLSPWTFTSDDGRFVMDFEPVMDRASCTSVGVIKSDQHQVFGRFSGTAVLDDGRVLEIKDFMGFAEKVENKW